MYDVTIEVRAKGCTSDFENNVTVEYMRVKSVEQVNFIQKAIADALFGMEAAGKQALEAAGKQALEAAGKQALEAEPKGR